MYLKYMHKNIIGEKLDLKNPKGFNAKLQWLKLYDRKPEYCRMVDKYEVKKYVAQKIGEEFLIPTLGIYNRFEEIDFDALPNEFVLKCTHDSGSVVICRDKATFDMKAAKKKLKKKMRTNLFWHGREWVYKGVKPRIIAEKYMQDGEDKDLKDYKFYCFGGVSKFLYISQGLSDYSTARVSYVSLDWEKEPFHRSDFATFEELPSKPVSFDEMIEFCKILSQDIPFLRVDFYEINRKLYFGEMTFFPGAGFTALEPAEWEAELGEWITLPEKKV